MSRIPQPASRGVPPRTGGIPRPSSGFATESATRATVPPTTPSASGPGPSVTSKSSMKRPCPGTTEKKKRDGDYELPPLSMLKRTEVKGETEYEKLKKKTVRRNAPDGEDIKQIKEIMKNIKGQDISVHEFVGLVAPYTADNGTVLRTVLATELSHFRTLARKVYDTMTQDISDVLINEHIQLSESSKEKHNIYGDKMMRAIDEIYEHFPNFDFEKYYTDADYMSSLCPPGHQELLDEVEEQNLLRQEAYHRMMWLRSEGERLGAENKKLQERLAELKLRQKEEMKRAAMIEQEKERKRLQLEETQEKLQDQLEDMNNSLERALVEEEIGLGDTAALKVAPPARKPPETAPKAKTRQAENWNVRAAAEIEEATTAEALIAETSRVSLASSKSSTGAVPKAVKSKKKKKRRQPPVPQEGSPFHYSPPRTPPEPRRQTSPFHYSPPKTPPQLDQAEGGGLETTRVTTKTRTIEQPSPCSRGRKSQGPRDSWGGFQ